MLPNGELIDLKSSFKYGENSSLVTVAIEDSVGFMLEHKMLGEMEALKTAVDDDMLDAIKEIGSNVTGAIANSINAQGDKMFSGVKFTVDSASLGSVDTSSFSSLLRVVVSDDSNAYDIYFLVDDSLASFLSGDLTGATDVVVTADTQESSCDQYPNLELLMNVELDISVRIGSRVMLLKDIVKLDLGDVIELDQLVNNPLDILVNGIKIADGEAVVVGGNFAVKIKTMGSKKDRMSALRIAS